MKRVYNTLRHTNTDASCHIYRGKPFDSLSQVEMNSRLFVLPLLFHHFICSHSHTTSDYWFQLLRRKQKHLSRYMQTFLTTTKHERIRTNQKNHIKGSASQNLEYVWLIIVCRRHRTRPEAQNMTTRMISNTSWINQDTWSDSITRVVCFMASLAANDSVRFIQTQS